MSSILLKGTKVFAPNKDVAEMNHLTQKPTGQQRNILQEAARIARGDIQPLERLHAQGFDALALPGGYGAALYLCNVAEEKGGSYFSFLTKGKNSDRNASGVRCRRAAYCSIVCCSLKSSGVRRTMYSLAMV